jgi:hypothetical protein
MGTKAASTHRGTAKLYRAEFGHGEGPFQETLVTEALAMLKRIGSAYEEGAVNAKIPNAH